MLEYTNCIKVNEIHYQINTNKKERKMRMMPLTMAIAGEANVIKRVGGKEETKRFLENLGFTTGGMVTVVSDNGGNMIVNVKESRVAINKDMANKIMI